MNMPTPMTTMMNAKAVYSRQRVSGVPSAASVIETSIVATNPNRSMSNAKAGAFDQHGLEPEQRPCADQAPREDTRQDAGARSLSRSHVIVGADPQRGEPDADEQQPSREILTALDAHAQTPSPHSR